MLSKIGETKLRNPKIIGYAALVTMALAMLAIGTASVSWADWCNGGCY
jgi:hypothetical protein